MKKYISFLIVLIFFILFLPHYVNSLRQRPLYEKLGFRPLGKLYKCILGEFRWIVGDYFTFIAITYYGGKVEKISKKKNIEVEYYNLYKTIETAVILNPYHEDAYYFAQAVFIWDIGRVREVNALLRYMAKYRTWDYQIPFFLGFNYAFLLKDYEKAAIYFKKSASLSKNPLYIRLTARYFYESGRTKLGISFLRYMIKNIHNKRIKLSLEKRLKALERIYFIEQAVKIYKRKLGQTPTDIYELIEKGVISQIPEDPYGGKFYLDKNGKVRTTSNLRELWKKRLLK